MNDWLRDLPSQPLCLGTRQKRLLVALSVVICTEYIRSKYRRIDLVYNTSSLHSVRSSTQPRANELRAVSYR
jgi:hypothetical protein